MSKRELRKFVLSTATNSLYVFLFFQLDSNEIQTLSQVGKKMSFRSVEAIYCDHIGTERN
jgi:hypothetical protein